MADFNNEYYVLVIKDSNFKRFDRLLLIMLRPFYAAFRPFYMALRPFYVTLRPFYVTLRPFYAAFRPFYVTFRAFYVTVESASRPLPPCGSA